MKTKKIKIMIITLLSILSMALFIGCDTGFDEEKYLEARRREIKVSANDSAFGSVEGGGIYLRDEYAFIKAIPNEGCRFLKWSDGITDEERQIKITDNQEFIAVFERIPDPTAITSVFIPNNFIWGSDEYFNSNAKAHLYYDNGEDEAVSISDMIITDISTENIGKFEMTLSYKGLEAKKHYTVRYSSVDVSNLSAKLMYTLCEALDMTGYIMAKGEGGKSEKIWAGDERIKISGFDSNEITYDFEKKEIIEKNISVSLNYYNLEVFKLPYSVWYTALDKKFSYASDVLDGKYNIKITDFSLKTDGTFEILITKLKYGKLNLTEEIYEVENFRRMTWEIDEQDPKSVILCYQKNAIAKKKKIGYFNAEYHVLTIYKETFDSGLLPIEMLLDFSIGFSKK